MRAWRHARACAGTDPRPWVTTIARREALRIAMRRQEELFDDAESLTGHGHVEAAGVEERLDIRAALGQLSQPEKEALLLHYWADMSQQQIAAAICKSDSARTLHLVASVCDLSLGVGLAELRAHRLHADGHAFGLPISLRGGVIEQMIAPAAADEREKEKDHGEAAGHHGAPSLGAGIVKNRLLFAIVESGGAFVSNSQKKSEGGIMVTPPSIHNPVSSVVY